ncbi:MAG: IPExxxVDY family protein [Bacteroidetes bacterium]|nr:IPExxxVDY family protein [Bacteroidales bacterium]MBU1010386.1 IPExxxVDY family protein [Bacteroidota bacterium]
MAAKKNVIKVDPFDDLIVICISSTGKDYALAWHINDKLGLELSRRDDLLKADTFGDLSFSFYYFDEGENQNIFNLIANNSEGNLLLSLPLRTDYFLIIRNRINEARLTQILNTLRSIPQVQLAYQLDLSKHKQVDVMLEEVEFHELSTLKKQQKRQHKN